MNNYLVTLNTGSNVMYDNARASLREAARRWKCDYLEVVTPLRNPNNHHWHEKLLLPQHLPPDIRVVYCDGDLIVRSDCPSPFMVVPEDSFGYVPTVRSDWALHNVYNPIKHWCKNDPVLDGIDWHHHYPNTGFLVYNTTLHRPIFDVALSYVEKYGYNSHWTVADQGPTFLGIATAGVPTFRLPAMYNFSGPHLWQGWTPTMRTLTNHFCGPIDKNIGIPRTVWDDLGPARLMPNGQTRWHTGKPAALLEGNEVPFLIREMSKIEKGRIVEIGSYLGGSTWYGGQIARSLETEYYAVDSWRGAEDLAVDDTIYDGFMANMRDAGLDDYVKVIKSESVPAAARFEDGSLDLVFVDGDHTHDGCLGDINAYWPKLKVGGVMLGHDYGSHDGVTSAVNHRFGRPEELSEGRFKIWKVTKSAT